VTASSSLLLVRSYVDDHTKKDEIGKSSENKNAYKVMVGNSEGKNPLGRYEIFRNRIR